MQKPLKKAGKTRDFCHTKQEREREKTGRTTENNKAPEPDGTGNCGWNIAITTASER
jgi:hypothetical protein